MEIKSCPKFLKMHGLVISRKYKTATLCGSLMGAILRSQPDNPIQRIAMKNWMKHHTQLAGFKQMVARARHRTLVDVIFDDWFRYCFSFDGEAGRNEAKRQIH